MWLSNSFILAYTINWIIIINYSRIFFRQKDYYYYPLKHVKLLYISRQIQHSLNTNKYIADTWKRSLLGMRSIYVKIKNNEKWLTGFKYLCRIFFSNLLLWLFLWLYTYRTILKLLTYLCQSVRPDYFLLLLILYTNYVCLHTILAILKCIFFAILPWSKYLIKYLSKYLIKYFNQGNITKNMHFFGLLPCPTLRKSILRRDSASSSSSTSANRRGPSSEEAPR